jgi:hypothetical protein
MPRNSACSKVYWPFYPYSHRTSGNLIAIRGIIYSILLTSSFGAENANAACGNNGRGGSRRSELASRLSSALSPIALHSWRLGRLMEPVFGF